MNLTSALIAAGSVIFLIYLLMPDRSRSPKAPVQSSRNARKNRAKQIGGMTGFMGGDVEDAMISRHALDRAHGDNTNSTSRDVATAVAMQQAQPPE